MRWLCEELFTKQWLMDLGKRDGCRGSSDHDRQMVTRILGGSRRGSGDRGREERAARLRGQGERRVLMEMEAAVLTEKERRHEESGCCGGDKGEEGNEVVGAGGAAGDEGAVDGEADERRR